MKFPYTENFKVQFHSIRDRPIPVAFKKITTTPYVGESFRIFFKPFNFIRKGLLGFEDVVEPLQ